MNKQITLEIIPVKPGDTLPTCEVLAWTQQGYAFGMLRTTPNDIWIDFGRGAVNGGVTHYAILPTFKDITG